MSKQEGIDLNNKVSFQCAVGAFAFPFWYGPCPAPLSCSLPCAQQLAHQGTTKMSDLPGMTFFLGLQCDTERMFRLLHKSHTAQTRTHRHIHTHTVRTHAHAVTHTHKRTQPRGNACVVCGRMEILIKINTGG